MILETSPELKCHPLKSLNEWILESSEGSKALSLRRIFPRGLSRSLLSGSVALGKLLCLLSPANGMMSIICLQGVFVGMRRSERHSVNSNLSDSSAVHNTCICPCTCHCAAPLQVWTKGPCHEIVVSNTLTALRHLKVCFSNSGTESTRNLP